jgi:hypothetical protein
MRACTASCVELLSHEHLPGPIAPKFPYLARIEFLSLSEWERELDQAYAALTDEETGLIVQEAPKDKDSKASVAWWKLKSIFGLVCDRLTLEAPPRLPSTKTEVSQWLLETLPDAPWSKDAAQAALREDVDLDVLSSMTEEELATVLYIPDPASCSHLCGLVKAMKGAVSPAESVRRLLQQTFVSLQAPTAQDLHLLILPYVDSTNELSKGALWPLVRRVQVFGPWSEYIGSTILIDAPGIQDDNSARDKVVTEKMRSADVVLIVSNIRRAVNDQSAKAWLPRPFRQKLVNEGRPGACAFIATASDWLEPSEIAANLNLPVDTPRLECALKRNEYTKRGLTIDWYDGLDVSRNEAAKIQRDRAIEEAMLSRQALGFDQPASQSQEDKPSSTTAPPKVARGINRASYRKKSALWRKINALSASLDTQVQSSVFLRTHSSIGLKTTIEALEVAMGQAFEHEHPGLSYEWEVKPASVHPALPSLSSCSEGSEDKISSRFTFSSFTVSAQDCQKLEGKRPASDGPPHTFFSIEDTQIPALRAMLKSLSAEARVEKSLTSIDSPSLLVQASIPVPPKANVASKGFISIDLDDDEPPVASSLQPSAPQQNQQPLPPFLVRVRDALEALNDRIQAQIKSIGSSKVQTYSDKINLTAMETFSAWISSFLKRDVQSIHAMSQEVQKIDKTMSGGVDLPSDVAGDRPGEWLMAAMEAVKTARDKEDDEMNEE